MATNRRDVLLVIRAKEDAAKAFETVAESLTGILNVNNDVSASANKVGTDIQALASLAVTLDRAYAKISNSADSAAASFARQEAVIASQRAELSALKSQAEATQRAMSALESALVDRGLAGDTAGQERVREQIRATDQESTRLERTISKLSSTIQVNEATLDGQRSGLQQVSSIANAAEAAQRQLAETIANSNRLIQEQSRAASVLPRIEAATGVSRDRGDYDQLVAQLRAESDAHDALIGKLRTEQNLRSENLALEEARSRAARLLPGDTTTGKSARDSARVFEEADVKAAKAFDEQIKANAKTTADMDAAAKRLRAEINPLAEVQERLNIELAEANVLYRAGKLSATELAQATELLKANADRAAQSLGRQSLGSGKPAIFGLKPYDIQNLGFQINDIVTQLASGTSLTQTLAQQGGQILQIFPNVGSVIVRALSNPAILAATASIGTMVLALRSAQREEATIRVFEASLSSTADASAYQARELNAASEAIDRYGVSAKEATAIVRTFTKEGVNPERLIEFGQAAKDMSVVLGIEVKDAATQLAQAFTADYAAIKRLDAAVNFLTAQERERIKVLFEEGRAQEGRTRAFELFVRRYDDASDKMRGPWKQAAEELGAAWKEFMQFLGDRAVVQGMADGLQGLSATARTLLRTLNNTRQLVDIQRDMAAVQSVIDQRARAGMDPGQFGVRLEALKAEAAALEAKANGADTRAAGTEREAKATADLASATAELAEKNKTLSAAQRIAAAEKKAGSEADAKLAEDAFKFASDAAKAEYRRTQVAQARREIEAEITREQKEQARERRREEERAIKDFSRKVVGVESGGNPNAKNPNSSATGLGQFIEKTWLDLFRKNFPAEAANMGREAILELRKDSQISKSLIEVYARENATRLKTASQSVTEANLYLAHFLGPDGALKVLRAAAATPTSALLGEDAINANAKILKGKTAGDVRNFAARKFGEASAADSAITQRLADIEQERLETQARFDERVLQENQRRREGIVQLTAQKGLLDEALIAEQRREAMADAVLQKQQEVDRINAGRKAQGLPGEIQFTDEQRQAVEQLTAAYFDLDRARDLAQAQTDSATRPVADLTSQRDALRAQIDLLRQMGDFAGAESIVPSLDATNQKLQQAIDKAIAFYQALNPADDPLQRTEAQIQGIIAGLESARLNSVEWGTVLTLSGREVAQAFAGNAGNAVDSFVSRIEDGQGAVEAFFASFRQGAADFLRLIAQMILQQLALNAAKSVLSSFGIPVGTNHNGGIAGRDRSSTRRVSAAWFNNAVRYHTGGIAGLAPNEVPAILQRGEEVLTRADPRHVANGGGAAGERISIFNLLDASDVLQRALGTRVGEETILNFIRANSAAVNGALNP